MDQIWREFIAEISRSLAMSAIISVVNIEAMLGSSPLITIKLGVHTR